MSKTLSKCACSDVVSGLVNAVALRRISINLPQVRLPYVTISLNFSFITTDSLFRLIWLGRHHSLIECPTPLMLGFSKRAANPEIFSFFPLVGIITRPHMLQVRVHDFSDVINQGIQESFNGSFE